MSDAEIKAKLKADEDREWDFAYKVQNDQTEIEKAILFAGEGGNLNYKDTISFVGDQTLINLEKLSDTTFLGDLKSTFSILLRLEKDNTSSVEIIRVLLRQLHNLLRIKISTMSGLNIETVLNGFKPPIYFK